MTTGVKCEFPAKEERNLHAAGQRQRYKPSTTSHQRTNHFPNAKTEPIQIFGACKKLQKKPNNQQTDKKLRKITKECGEGLAEVGPWPFIVALRSDGQRSGICCGILEGKLTKHGNSCKSSNYLKIIAIALCPFGGPQIAQKQNENAKRKKTGRNNNIGKERRNFEIL